MPHRDKVDRRRWMRAWYIKNRARIREQHRASELRNRAKVLARLKKWNAGPGVLYKHGWNLKRYGLTLESYATMLERQRGCCAICRLKVPLCVDHCHTTGVVRGLICKKCNTAIGLLSDSVKLVASALKYLRHGKSKTNDG